MLVITSHLEPPANRWKMQDNMAGMSEHSARCGEWYMCTCETSRRRFPGTHRRLCCSNTLNRPFPSITDSVMDLCWRERVPSLNANDSPGMKFKTSHNCVPLVTSRKIVAMGSEIKCDRAYASTTTFTAVVSSSVDVPMTHFRYARLPICVNCF